MPPQSARPSAIGWQRPVLSGAAIPALESRRRQWAIRALAIVTLLASAGYLAWRATATVNLSVWWLSVPLLLLEIHAALGLALFTFALWDVDHRPRSRDVTWPSGVVAVLIPTYNESPEILTPTIAAAVAMRLPHQTWVLDDGNRSEVAELAGQLGAHYLARSERAHAKAGNLNNALSLIRADFVAVLDADHVASPDFLVRTLGYFDDPRVALVQTPQDFYNTDSFEHDDGSALDGHHEQALFYRVLQPAKNRWRAAFWCGTGAVVRVAALRDVGGVATDTITEDIHTTIRLHRRGWRTVYHNEVLARGLAAADAATYQAQRLRWGTGAMQVLRLENPLVVSGLSLAQRLAYASTLLGWFDAWRTLGFLILPIAVIVTGASPILARPEVFFPLFALTFVLQQLALRVLSRGFHRPLRATVFELVRMNANIRATLTLISRGRPRFTVTPKGRTGDQLVRTPAPVVLICVELASLAAALWFLATSIGVGGAGYTERWAVNGAAIWLAANGVLVAVAIRRIRSWRFAPERRASVRFAISEGGQLGEVGVAISDLSMSGARVIASHGIQATAGSLSFEIGDEQFSFKSIVRTAVQTDTGWEYGLEFEAGQDQERARLALAIFTVRGEVERREAKLTAQAA